MGRAVYQSDTGVGYDGIRSATEMSDNSGAESTIEALLAPSRLSIGGESHTSKKATRGAGVAASARTPRRG